MPRKKHNFLANNQCNDFFLNLRVYSTVISKFIEFTSTSYNNNKASHRNYQETKAIVEFKILKAFSFCILNNLINSIGFQSVNVLLFIGIGQYIIILFTISE